jgi:hypothetical protein
MSQLLTTFFFSDKYKISKKTSFIILLSPFLLVLIQMILFIVPTTRNLAFWLLEENHPIEIATFIIFFIAGIFGLYNSFTNAYALNNFIKSFYIIFCICLIIIAMEEIAWGQWFFNFETPNYWKQINRQGETTLHNLKGIQGNTEIFRFIYGLGGFIGIFLKDSFYFTKIKPSRLLIPWFAIIIVHSILDYISDFINIQENINYAFSKSSELIEFLISISAFVYLWLNLKMFNKN